MSLGRTNDPIAEIVTATYLDFLGKIDDPNYCQERAMPTPKIDFVKKLNDYMISLILVQK